MDTKITDILLCKGYNRNLWMQNDISMSAIINIDCVYVQWVI